jgi:hypothetical protein
MREIDSLVGKVLNIAERRSLVLHHGFKSTLRLIRVGFPRFRGQAEQNGSLVKRWTAEEA